MVSLKDNGPNYFLCFHISFGKKCKSEAFVDFATAERQRKLSTTYKNNNLFHQSKLGPDVELQDSLIVLFESCRDVMQVSTLSVQTGLGSELVDWYRDATSVPYSRETIDYVIVQTPDPCCRSFTPRTGWNNYIFWTMNTQNLSTLQMFQSSSRKCNNIFVQSFPKQLIRFLW